MHFEIPPEYIHTWFWICPTQETSLRHSWWADHTQKRTTYQKIVHVRAHKLMIFVDWLGLIDLHHLDDLFSFISIIMSYTYDILLFISFLCASKSLLRSIQTILSIPPPPPFCDETNIHSQCAIMLIYTYFARICLQWWMFWHVKMKNKKNLPTKRNK